MESLTIVFKLNHYVGAAASNNYVRIKSSYIAVS